MEPTTAGWRVQADEAYQELIAELETQIRPGASVGEIERVLRSAHVPFLRDLFQVIVSQEEQQHPKKT
ncbi:hypothetical protein [Deinococcus sp.]|uniref:hypothetical protein n=1 Tax=Deinococcus sp. TaxID=47478 RepID=UPI0025E57796|nr:hypothetical protein [Deinococcus sp.]